MRYKRIKLSRLNIRIDYKLEKQINEEAKLAGLTKTDFIIGAGDIEENIRDEVRDLVEQAVEIHIDHLRGKYGEPNDKH